MSRWKRFVIGTVITLVLLGGTTTLWYQSHYVAPLAQPIQVLPRPNGFDTLNEATDLAANPAFLKKTREALTQEYLVPYEFRGQGAFLYQHGDHLQSLIGDYAVSGNLPEAMRCALDALEIGMIASRGGNFNMRAAADYHKSGGDVDAWKLAVRVDARVAREAVARLERMEARRWPLSENLRVQLQQRGVERTVSEFRGGPVSVWKKQALDNSVETRGAKEQKESRMKSVRALWSRVRAVYGGPRWVREAQEDCVRRAQERLETWDPDRPMLEFGVPAPYYMDSFYSTMEPTEFIDRTHAALLRTYLALRAYKLERGSYPQSLETLVTEGYLKAVPKDPFSSNGAPLGYKPDGTLWSIGPDAKDDGGKPIPEKNNPSDTREPVGDLVPGSDSFSARLSSL